MIDKNIYSSPCILYIDIMKGCTHFLVFFLQLLLFFCLPERPARQIPNEGTKPRPAMIVMIVSILCIGIIFSLTVSSLINITV